MYSKNRPPFYKTKPDEIPRWPEWLHFTVMVIGLQKGNRLRIVVPVTNERNHDIVLRPRRVFGQLQQVKVVYPADVRLVSTSDNRNSTASTPEHHKEENRKCDSCTHDSWDLPVSVDHLTPDQQKKSETNVTRRKCSIFKDDICGMYSITTVTDQTE